MHILKLGSLLCTLFTYLFQNVYYAFM